MEGNASQSAGNGNPYRPYYVAPSPEDFIDTYGASSSDKGLRAGGVGVGSTSSGKLPARYARVTDLLDETEGWEGSLGERSGMLRSFVSSALLGYASTACVMPFEVGKTLMQVQWIPKADVELLNEYDDEDLGYMEGAGGEQVIYDIDELSDEDDAQAYFHDLSNNPNARGRGNGEDDYMNYGARRRRRGASPAPENAAPEGLQAPLMAPRLSVTRAKDPAGYIERRTIFEQDTKPSWILPFTVTGGVWDMMKAIGRWKGEGWLSLWKGQLTTFFLESASSLIQPTLYSLFVTLFLRDATFSSLPLVHMPSPLKPLAVTIASHILTSYLLSPLDLIRTRLIVQSTQGRHKKYTGPLHALRTISEEEGGLSSIYLHSNLAFPTILESGIRSFFHLAIPLFIERQFLITPDSNSIIYGLAEFTFNTCSLLFVLPIETVRRRLQIQSRAAVVGSKSGKSFKTCVETRPGNYVGILEAVYRIVTEETGKLHIHNIEQKPRRPSMSSRRNSSMNNNNGGMGSRRSSYRGGARPSQEEEEAAQAQREWSNATHMQAQAHPQAQAQADADIPDPPSLPMFAGVSQLYRGFSMGLGANLIVLILGLVAGRDDVGSGWTEV